MARATWSTKCGGCGWTESQRPRLTTGAMAMAGAAMPMPHRPGSTTAERGVERRRYRHDEGTPSPHHLEHGRGTV
eukprot:3954526-Pyramimonas_sp.AAC.1